MKTEPTGSAKTRELVELERAVVEAAVARRWIELRPEPTSKIDGGRYETASIVERHAVDALLAARAKSSPPTETES